MAVPAGIAILLVIQAAIWGSAFPMIKLGLEDFSAPHFTLLRHLVASVTFVPLLLAFKARLAPARRDVPYFLLLGVTGFLVYHLALNYGSVRVSAGAASLIIATAPAMTAIIAAFMAGDRLPFAGWIGSTLSFLGVALIVLGDGSELLANGFSLYASFVVIAAAATSFYAVLQRKMFANYRPIEVAAFATWLGTVPMLAFLPGIAGAMATASSTAWLAAVYNGVLPSAVAYTIFAFALSRAPVTVVTAFLYLVPLFGLGTAWLLLGEVPPLLTFLGGAIAITGVVVLNVAKQRSARRLALRAVA
ncbi:MAG TPA: DMT family transporter [Trueperaceae bacterium]|nr:DMT family transporter [Trueperaceae bacterium]